MTKPLRIAINGFGRIGRLVFRLGFGDPDFEFVALNDLGEPENMLYLLKYDTVYGRYGKELGIKNNELSVGKAKSSAQLVIGGKELPLFQEKEPLNLPWQELDIDLVIESTGAFESYEKAKVHLDAGAKRILLSAPSKDEDGENGKTVLIGVNEDDLKTCLISSNGSCTTNSAHPVIQILSEKIGIKKAILSTVHGYTATQNLVDGPVKGHDLRRGRAAGQNIVPSTTGAATTVTKAVKELAGRFDGIAFRVPVVAGSIADITMLMTRETTPEEINQILEEAAKEPRWNKIMKTTNEPLVSSDIVGQAYGAIVDLGFTKVVDGDLVKVLSWYDNEMGYTRTLIEHARAIKRVL
ncbi:MAG: glyceraldehyde 3-phosphate dehydrogenase NAD-binding domain-containing protein [Patescibacteria group bacterium]